MNSSEYLQAEIDRMGKAVRRVRILGGILLLVVIAYCGLAIWYVSVFTNPRSMVNVVIARFETQAPKIIALSEMKLIENAPESADRFSKWLQSEIPNMRVHMQDTIRNIVAEKSKELGDSTTRNVDQFLVEHKDLFPPRDTSETIEEYAGKIGATLADEFDQNIGRSLKKHAGDNTDAILKNSGATLGDWAKHTQELSSTSFYEENRKEQLQRLFMAFAMKEYLKNSPGK